MFIRSLADFNGTPWAVQVTVGAITVTAQATSSPDRHDKQGSGDFYLAISGDLQLATSGDFYRATVILAGHLLVGHQACLGHGGGHTTWTFRTCDQTLFGPPLNTHCSPLDGPATVRLSSGSLPTRPG